MVQVDQEIGHVFRGTAQSVGAAASSTVEAVATVSKAAGEIAILPIRVCGKAIEGGKVGSWGRDVCAGLPVEW